MPHPFLIVAGVVIFIGTGVLLVNEYQQYKSEEAQFNRIALERSRRKDYEDEDETEKSLSPSCYQTFRIDPFKSYESNAEDQIPYTLRNRFQTNQDRNRNPHRIQNEKQNTFPLVDLSDQDASRGSNQSFKITNPIQSNQIILTEIQSDTHLKEGLREVNQATSTSFPSSPSVSSPQESPSHEEEHLSQRDEGSVNTEGGSSERKASSSHGEEMPPQIPTPEINMGHSNSIDSNNPTNTIEFEINSNHRSSKPSQSVSSKISFDELRSNQSDESSNWLEIESHNSTDEFELM
ncbi:secreted protein [Melampsora americana]|nr:secreted protein [Melampsora americana]